MTDTPRRRTSPVVAIVAAALGLALVVAAVVLIPGWLASAPTDPQPGTEHSNDQDEQATPAPDGSSADAALPFGSVVSVDSSGRAYDVSFGAIEWDATAIVAEENRFNADPSPGMKYLMVPVTVTNTDDESWSAGGTFFWDDIEFVSQGQTFREPAVVEAPSGLAEQGDIAPGATVTGNVVFEVPVETDGGAWQVAGVFVAAK
jgi:hypothetical protein